ncbi:MAG: heavy-metal-associated domain-containing protein [bacterium]|nr:heavy-metal-associated domain-containing protein [bacterium]
MKEVKFLIEGMHCNGCVMNVTKAILNLPGIEDVKVTLETKEAKIIFDPDEITLEEIKEAVIKSGYKPV